MSELSGTDAVMLVLMAMSYLLIKHAVADFLLQTENQRLTKGTYGALGGVTHGLTHVALTLPVFFIVAGVPLTIAAALLAAEFVIHYHLDWCKDQVVRRQGWTSHDTPFWWALGIDQLLHGLTYVAIVWVACGALST